ncbi:F-box/FBD/LRR-repeat protein [Forsythia ovata]|uniref:F-box/FBD/LRR-repeat protein n=1 Tax=Forsythia ovata TaxID=205694 RepID=A0ABD1NTX5_9LAMI
MDISQFQSVDRISNLPDNVIDKILMQFTIRDATKTSILSKEWRYKWLNLPQLIFDDTLWQKSERNRELARMNFVGILYQVLLRHQGPVTKMSLIIPELIGGSEIDHLIYFLWKKGVEEFTLKMMVGKDYKLPSSLFMCLQLKHLSLYSCLINPPPSFKGFNRMIRLELDFVTIDARVLENLISSCPLLEQLVLHFLSDVDYLEIDAPMLKLFELNCSTASVFLKNSPHLAIVSVACGKGCDFGDGIRSLIEFFDSVPALQKLHMDYHFVKFFFPDDHKAIPATFNNLKILKLSDISLESFEELSSVFRLMRSCPNLEEVKIETVSCADDDTSEIMDFLKAQDYSDVLLNRLKKVMMSNIIGLVPEMALIKLLLEKSPTLKRMVIVWCGFKFDDELLRTMKELNRFSRASPNAEVNFETRNQLRRPHGYSAVVKHDGSLRRIGGSNSCDTWKATFLVGRQWSTEKSIVECPAQLCIGCDRIRIYLGGEQGGNVATLQD